MLFNIDYQINKLAQWGLESVVVSCTKYLNRNNSYIPTGMCGHEHKHGHGPGSLGHRHGQGLTDVVKCTKYLNGNYSYRYMCT